MCVPGVEINLINYLNNNHRTATHGSGTQIQKFFTVLSTDPDIGSISQHYSITYYLIITKGKHFKGTCKHSILKLKF